MSGGVTLALGGGLGTRRFEYWLAWADCVTPAVITLTVMQILAGHMVALPGQTLIYAVLVMGIFFELPHLTLLRRVLSVLRRVP
ncbi:hypothetical protein [Halomonas sp.]|uniref:hypothetical protein n=1 Tax=Halomonas sp. TaxID=1486246 RepID=UPI003F90D3EE